MTDRARETAQHDLTKTERNVLRQTLAALVEAVTAAHPLGDDPRVSPCIQQARTMLADIP